MDTLRKKIGQMFLLGFRGMEVGENDPIARDIRELDLGGVLLFDYDVALQAPRRNIRSPEQVGSLVAALQDMAETPLLVAVDEEGGQIARFKKEHGFPEVASASELGRDDDPGRTRQAASTLATAMADAGVNLNFAPNVDLALNPSNPIIAGKERSFSADPAAVTRHAREVIEAHRAAGVLCAIKHYPGHGSSLADTHLGFVDVTATWSEQELEPFANLVAEFPDLSVMTAHIFNAHLDPDYPATLSKRIITDLLRGEFGFRGVVFTDDMEMKAISARYGLEVAIYHAITAGVDILTYANNVVYEPDLAQRGVEIVTRFVREGRISEKRIDESVARIQKLKQSLLAVQ